MGQTAVGYLLVEVLPLAEGPTFKSVGRLVVTELNHVLRFGITRRIMAYAADTVLPLEGGAIRAVGGRGELIRPHAGYAEPFEARWYH